MRIPISLLRQVCYPTSYKLPKLERLHWPLPGPASKVSWHRPAVSTTPASIANRVPSRLVQPDEDNEGNLRSDDYRFFEGVTFNAGLYSKCRYCGIQCQTPQTRTAHLAAGACKFALLQVYKSLNDDPDCIVCGHETKSFRWGLRLCSARCRNRFRFGEPTTLAAAIAQYVKNGGMASA